MSKKKKQKCCYGIKWVPCEKLVNKPTSRQCKNPAKRGGMCIKHFKETGGVKRIPITQTTSRFQIIQKPLNPKL